MRSRAWRMNLSISLRSAADAFLPGSSWLARTSSYWPTPLLRNRLRKEQPSLKRTDPRNSPLSAVNAGRRLQSRTLGDRFRTAGFLAPRDGFEPRFTAQIFN